MKPGGWNFDVIISGEDNAQQALSNVLRIYLCHLFLIVQGSTVTCIANEKL